MTTVRGRAIETGVGTVALDGSGAGTLPVTFVNPFVGTPHVTIVPHLGDTATLSAASVTNTGFTLTVTGSAILSQNAQFVWAAFEKS